MQRNADSPPASLKNAKSAKTFAKTEKTELESTGAFGPPALEFFALLANFAVESSGQRNADSPPASLKNAKSAKKFAKTEKTELESTGAFGPRTRILCALRELRGGEFRAEKCRFTARFAQERKERQEIRQTEKQNLNRPEHLAHALEFLALLANFAVEYFRAGNFRFAARFAQERKERQ